MRERRTIHLPFRISRRRRDVLGLLAEFSFLRTSHFYALLDPDPARTGTVDTWKRAVRRTLRDLTQPFAHGARYVLRETLLDHVGDRVRGEDVYFLSEAGFNLVEAEGIPETLDLVLNRFASVSLDRIRHEVGISEVHLYVRDFADAHGLPYYWQQTGLKKSDRAPNPDAFFAITAEGSPRYYFLEFQTSTAGHSVDGKSDEVRKFERYAAYYGSDFCARDWQRFSTFRVIFVFANPVRATHVLRKIAAEYPENLFMVATLGDLKDRTWPAFRMPGDAAPRALATGEAIPVVSEDT